MKKTLYSTTSLQPLHFTDIYQNNGQTYENEKFKLTLAGGHYNGPDVSSTSAQNTLAHNDRRGVFFYTEKYDPVYYADFSSEKYLYPDGKTAVYASTDWETSHPPIGGYSESQKLNLKNNYINFSGDLQFDKRSNAVEFQLSYNPQASKKSSNYSDKNIPLSNSYSLYSTPDVASQYNLPEFKNYAANFTLPEYEMQTPKAALYTGYRQQIDLKNGLLAHGAVGTTANFFSDKHVSMEFSGRVGVQASLGNFGSIYGGFAVNTAPALNKYTLLDNQVKNLVSVIDKIESGEGIVKWRELSERDLPAAIKYFENPENRKYPFAGTPVNTQQPQIKDEASTYNKIGSINLDKQGYFGYKKEFKLTEGTNIFVSGYATVNLGSANKNSTYTAYNEAQRDPSVWNDKWYHTPVDGIVLSGVTHQNIKEHKSPFGFGLTVGASFGGNHNQMHKNPCKF